MWLVAGLGNPGIQYALTRHNIGFLSVDLLHKACGHPPLKNDFSAQVAKFKWDNQDILTLQPLTYMNRSGEAVLAAMQFYKISMENLIVIHDEIDFPFAGMKIQKNRSPGGHNGVKDISLKLGSDDYIRLRLGVGRPPHPEMPVPDYVLQKFSKQEMQELPGFLEKSVDAIESVIFDGLQKASTKFNS